MRRLTAFALLLAGLGLCAPTARAQDANAIVGKYDFIPGAKVIFFDDFTQESVGDFPALWMTNGSGGIVTSGKFPGRWLQIAKAGYYIPEAKEDFTDNFTIEFDFVPMNVPSSPQMFGLNFFLIAGSLSEPGGGGEPGPAGIVMSLLGESLLWKNWAENSDRRDQGNVAFAFNSGEKYRVSIWVQKQRVRLYANESKILDVPRGLHAGFKPNIFRVEVIDEAQPLIANFRIAAGLPDMRNKLLTEGKIVSYGIQFDVNSDKVKPESYATIKEIADILKETPALRVRVVGHTDSDGVAAANLDLSKRRGASVKTELVSKFGIDAARLETDGKGATEPLAPNTSGVNKAKNRRVEFVAIKAGAGAPAGAASTPGAAGPAITGMRPFVDARDGKSYRTTTIGTQTWMAENLAFKPCADGCWPYENTPANAAAYGYLYSWEASRKACPPAWHLPTDAEWSTLVESLGGESAAGGKLKEAGVAHWASPNTGATNETGFAALPGGARSYDGKFATMARDGSWWTATEDDAIGAWYHGMYNRTGEVRRFRSLKLNGFSVRCVRDVA
jgi:uncharacterized protein (TIGR02145 family)